MSIQTREVSGFSAVELRGVGTLRIEIGDTESLTIEAADELQSAIMAEVIGGKLIIKFDAWQAIVGWAKSTPITMRLTARQLTAVVLTGSGSIEASIPAESLEFSIQGAGSVRAGVRTTNLSVNVSGTGDVTLAGFAENQEVRIGGAGTYDSMAVESKSASIFIGGAGRAKVNASEKLYVQIGGAGTVQYLGNPHVDQRIGGFGKVEKAPEAPTTPGAPA